MPVQNNPPGPQQPPRLTSAASSGAATTPEPSVDSIQELIKDHMISFLLLLLVLGGVALLVHLNDKPGLSFKVESVSVSVGNGVDDDSMIPAEWDIGFSVENSHGWSSFDVSVECMSRSWPGEVAELFADHRRRNAVYLNATVNTTMPHYIVPGVISGLRLEFDVVLSAHYWWGGSIRGVCTNMTVGFQSTAEKGFLVGGRRSCALDYF